MVAATPHCRVIAIGAQAKTSVEQHVGGGFGLGLVKTELTMKTPSILILALSGLILHPVQAAPKVAFDSQVKPLLTSRCINCHYSGGLFGELNLENRAMAFKKRVNGPVILPGKPDSSALYLVLKMPPKNPKAMPPDGHRIPDKEVTLIYDWIKQGADWPKGAAGVITPSKAVKP